MRVYSMSYHFLQLLVSLELKSERDEEGVEDINGGREEEKTRERLGKMN